ncbi:MAG: polysaccharide biosynthesis C-terminal domain-containing protein [Candidatus Asgardarchaeia archaeon]
MALKLGTTIAKWAIILTSLDYAMLIATSLFSIVIVVNLTPKYYGLFSISSATYLIISSLLQTFFAYPFIRSISRYLGQEDFEKISYTYGNMVTVALFSSSFIAFLHAAASSFLAESIFGYPQISFYMELLSVNIVSQVLIALFRGILLSFKAYQKAAISRSLDGIFYILGISMMAYIEGWTLIAVVLGTIVYLFLSCVATIILGFLEMKKYPIRFLISFKRIDLLKENISLGKLFIIGNGFAYFFMRWDILVVTLFVHNATLIGYYSFAKNLFSRVKIVFGKINSLLYPIFSEQDAKSQYEIMRKLLNAGNILALIFSFAVSMFIVFFSKELIVVAAFFISGLISYIDAYPVFCIFGLLLIPYSLDVGIIPYFNGIGDVGKLVKANAILLFSSFFLMPTFSMLLGVIGAALAYITSQFFRMSYWIYVAHKKVNIKLKKYPLIFLSAFISAALVKVLFYVLIFQVLSTITYATEIFNLLLLVVAVLTYGFLLLFLLVKTKVITARELNILQKSFGRNKFARLAIRIINRML